MRGRTIISAMLTRGGAREGAGLGIRGGTPGARAGRLGGLKERVGPHPGGEDRPASEAPPQRIELKFPAKISFDWRAFLPVLPFFEGFHAGEIDELASAGRVTELERGAGVFKAGAAASACYLVLRGALEIFTVNGKTEPRVAVSGPGKLAR